jgi:hypothetical protein
MNNRRLTPSDYTTEVTFCNSKSDVWAGLNIPDQIMQTNSRSTSISNGACLDIEQQLKGIKTDETTDLLSPTRAKSNANYFQQSTSKASSTSNLVLANENPWKKLNNVRYRLDGQEIKEKNPTKYQNVYAQHITFV